MSKMSYTKENRSKPMKKRQAENISYYRSKFIKFTNDTRHLLKEIDLSFYSEGKLRNDVIPHITHNNPQVKAIIKLNKNMKLALDKLIANYEIAYPERIGNILLPKWGHPLTKLEQDTILKIVEIAERNS